MPMSTPASQAPNAIPSGARISISKPSTSSKFPWLLQALNEPLHDFAPNAPFTSRRVEFADAGIGRKPAVSASVTEITGSVRSEEKERKGHKKAMDVDGNPSRPTGAIRSHSSIGSQRHRLFHKDQPYHPRLVSPASNSKLYDLPLELPQPTSPTNRRSFRKKNWLQIIATSRWFRQLSNPTTYLALYFILNLSLTLYNKSVLIKFPFPYTLSAFHALCGSIGSLILVKAGVVAPPPRLTLQETLALLAFSGLYTVNIIVSNVSLGLVTVPFHQVIRASTPLFTIAFSYILLGTRSSRAKLIALVPVMAGVGFATYGDYYYTPWGFFLALLGTVLAALKTIYTHLLQAAPTLTHSHSKSHIYDPNAKPPQPKSPLQSIPAVFRKSYLPPLTPLHLLYLLSPLAFVQTTFIAQFSGELAHVRAYAADSTLGPSNMRLTLLVMNGVMAFGLNVVSFSANRKVGALSMTVAANVKQVLTILCAVILFNLTITPMNGIGIALTLIGGAVYAFEELKERRHGRIVR